MGEKSISLGMKEVQAVLEGKKTQKRMVVESHWFENDYGDPHGDFWSLLEDLSANCPLGKVGDTLWVQEPFRQRSGKAFTGYGTRDAFPIGIAIEVEYRANEGEEDSYTKKLFKSSYYLDDRRPTMYLWDEWESWQPASQMTKEMSRLSLKIENIKVEKLQDITEEDAKAEGVDFNLAMSCNEWEPSFNDPDSGGNPDYIAGFKYMWEHSTKALDTSSDWDMDPFVWVITFSRIEESSHM